MGRKTKKEMVLDIYDREAMGEVTAREIAVINQALIEEFGEGGAMTPAEIARVLVDEDLPVRFEQIFRMSTPTEKYEILFEKLTINKTLAEAERSLRRISELRRKFLMQGDKTGVRFARETALRAKENAAALSGSPDLSGHERKVHSEISNWFMIWLQTPEMFEQWLELRKAAEEFKKLFLN